MARRINQDDIKEINELYLKYGTYTKVAAELGFAPSTVKKYVIPNYISEEELKKQQQRFDQSLLDTKFSYKPFLIENWGDLCVLTEAEKQNLEEFWTEIII